MTKVVSAYRCSWLTTWWGKGGFYSPCSPCSKHNRVPHTHYLITSKNRFLHISSSRKLAEREKTYFSFFSLPVVPEAMSHSKQLLDSFHTFFSSQGDGYTNVRALGAPGALLLLPSFCWILLGPEAPFQPSLGSGPAPLTPQQCWLCVGTPQLYITALSLVPSVHPPLQLLMGVPGWSLVLIHHFPCQEPLVDFVRAIVSSHTARACGAASTGEGMACTGVTLRSQLVPLWEELSLTEESSSDKTSVEKRWRWTTFILQCFCVQAVRNITGSVLGGPKTSAAQIMCVWWLCTGAKGEGMVLRLNVFLL